MFVEFPHFLYHFDGFANWLGCAGSNLIPGAYQVGGQLTEKLLFEEIPEAPLWEIGKYKKWVADRDAFSVRVAGQRLDFRPSKGDYARAGIIFEDERSGPNTIDPGQLLRFVSVALGHPFFLSQRELLTLVQHQSAPQMSLFMQPDWWQHPRNVIMDEDPDFADDWIENIPCWQILARAIASGDLSEWNAQNTSGFNTDWANLERI